MVQYEQNGEELKNMDFLSTEKQESLANVRWFYPVCDRHHEQ